MMIMTTTKLKNIITQRILEVEDINILNVINLILETGDTSKDTGVYKLTDIQKKKIKKSKLQFKEGMTISNEKVFEDMKKWIKEK